MDKSEIEIIEHLAMQESAIASLYAAFSIALPDMKYFWTDLVAQENAHAEVVWKLAELSKAPNVKLNTHAFNVETIRTNIAYLKQQRENVQASGITTIRALALALDTEKGLIDKNFFRIIESSAPEIARELRALETHTTGHLRQIEKRLREEQICDTKTIMKEAQMDVVGNLEQCEATLAELYNVYSTVIPEMGKFWKAISSSEVYHASLLKTLGDGIRDGKMTMNVERFTPRSFDLFLSLVRDAIVRAKASPLSAKDAIITALSIESSLMDADFYNTIQSDTPEFCQIASKLAGDTNQHINSIQNCLQNLPTPHRPA